MKESVVGPLMASFLVEKEAAASEEASLRVATRYTVEIGSGEGRIPVVVQFEGANLGSDLGWREYRSRTEEQLDPICRRMNEVFGAEARPLLAANSVQASVTPDQVDPLSELEGIRFLELDPLVQATLMDDVAEDVGLVGFRSRHPNRTGSGVRVAVLDSGIDLHHPFLSVAESVETCGESVDIPGAHGTHCAGSIASRDGLFSGIAPDVELLNVKVLTASGSGRQTWITKGIDEALDRGADVLSMSLGFNHLPRWSRGGHGWACPDGRCPLCTAADNAALLEEAVVVVAAGNEHEKAEALRAIGKGGSFDTELGCPGQAREVVTVGALTKRTFMVASFSSRGPAAYGRDKPSLSAPGVNVWSTAPVPRDSTGSPLPGAPRSALFGRMSGTSMATPTVAGAAALAIEGMRANGVDVTAARVRSALLSATSPLLAPHSEGGVGRLDLNRL